MVIQELYKLFLECEKVFTDSRQASRGGIFFALKGDKFDANRFALKAIEDGANYAIVDDQELKEKLGCIYVENTLDTLQQLANHHRNQLKTPVIGITGTNGKTTTKELIAAVLSEDYKVLATKGNFNNHIGVPLTLLELKKEHQIAVIEMGANHPGEIDFLCNIASPDLGIITNVGKAHLEGFGSFEGVKQTKSELYRYISNNRKNGIFINCSNPHLVELAKTNSQLFTYGLANSNAELIGEVANSNRNLTARIRFPKGWLYVNSKLSGAYNLENILAAARIGTYFKIDPLKIKDAIENYMPSNNRSQVKTYGTTTLILDCYNANPSSMQASLENLIQAQQKNKMVILGDMLELGDDSRIEHQKIVDSLTQQNLDAVVLVGPYFKACKQNSTFKYFNKVEELNKYLTSQNLSNKLILVKGSRGIQLEKIQEIFN